MKTAKEFVERLQSDGDFAAKVNEQLLALGDAGEADIIAATCKVAEAEDYEITPAQLKELTDVQTRELSEDELDKVAGGSLTTTLEMFSIYAITAATVSAATTIIVS